MKKLYWPLALAIVLALSGCGQSGSRTQTVPTERHTEAPVSSESEGVKKNFDDTESLNGKLSLYGTSTYFPDAFVPHKYLIISQSSVVCVQFFGSVESVTEIPKASVSRNETQAVDTFSLLKIFDRSGKSISFNAKPTDLNTILSEIQS